MIVVGITGKGFQLVADRVHMAVLVGDIRGSRIEGFLMDFLCRWNRETRLMFDEWLEREDDSMFLLEYGDNELDRDAMIAAKMVFDKAADLWGVNSELGKSLGDDRGQDSFTVSLPNCRFGRYMDTTFFDVGKEARDAELVQRMHNATRAAGL